MTAELEIRDSPRFLAGTLADLELTCYRDGTATDPASAGTVTVTDEDGNVLSSGAAAVVGSGSGLLRYTPTAAAMTNVNRLTVSWAGVVLGTDPAITLTSYGEVVGDMLFTEAQARAFGDGALAAAAYTDDDIRRGHDRILDAFQEILGFPLGRRYFQETLDGEGTRRLRLRNPYIRSVRAVKVRTAGSTTWTAYTAGELADVYARSWGPIERETLGVFPAGVQNVRVSYEAGKEIASELRRAALQLLRAQLVPSNLPDRARAMQSELGYFQLATAGEQGRWFGLPDVDAALARHRETSIW